MTALPRHSKRSTSRIACNNQGHDDDDGYDVNGEQEDSGACRTAKTTNMDTKTTLNTATRHSEVANSPLIGGEQSTRNRHAQTCFTARWGSIPSELLHDRPGVGFPPPFPSSLLLQPPRPSESSSSTSASVALRASTVHHKYKYAGTRNFRHAACSVSGNFRSRRS